MLSTATHRYVLAVAIFVDYAVQTRARRIGLNCPKEPCLRQDLLVSLFVLRHVCKKFH